MKLKSALKNKFGKCDTPENTIKRLEAAIGAQYEYRYVEEKVSEFLYWSALLIEEIGFRSMGKGIDPVMCKAGALAEGAEWLTATGIGSLSGYMAAHQDDMHEPFLKIEDLVSHVSSVTPDILKKIKKLDTAKHWVDGYSITKDCMLKVPIEYAQLVNGPSALASGNRIEEAIMHATDEVFERRTHVTVLRNRMVMPTIDIETIDSPVLRSQIDFCKSKGIEVYLKDLSFGGELPCIGAYLLDHNIPEKYQLHHFFKVGSCFDTVDALIRSFTEYAQGRRLDEFISGTKEEQEMVTAGGMRGMPCVGNDCDNFLSAFMFGFVPYADAEFLKEGDLVPFNSGARADDFLKDIERAKDIFNKLGLEYIYVDFTDPDIGFPVVQVVVPGYSDVLPYHPADSKGLFDKWTRTEVINWYYEHA